MDAQTLSLVFSWEKKQPSKQRIAAEGLEQRTQLRRWMWDLEKVHILSIPQSSLKHPVLSPLKIKTPALDSRGTKTTFPDQIK